MKKGFTLIELLVVVAIISLLSSIVLSSLSSARMKARDAQRVLSIKQLKNALELYRTDKGTYPSGYGIKIYNIPGLVPTYISKLPNDPSSNWQDDWEYALMTTKDGYELAVRFEDTNKYYTLIPVAPAKLDRCVIAIGSTPSGAWGLQTNPCKNIGN